jgi:hypothetical protein
MSTFPVINALEDDLNKKWERVFLQKDPNSEWWKACQSFWDPDAFGGSKNQTCKMMQ